MATTPIVDNICVKLYKEQMMRCYVEDSKDIMKEVVCVEEDLDNYVTTTQSFNLGFNNKIS